MIYRITSLDDNLDKEDEFCKITIETNGKIFIDPMNKEFPNGFNFIPATEEEIAKLLAEKINNER